MAYEVYKVKTADGKVYRLEYHGPAHGQERWFLTLGKGNSDLVVSFAGKGVLRPGYLGHHNLRVGVHINCRDQITEQITGLWKSAKGRIFMGWKRIESADQQ